MNQQQSPSSSLVNSCIHLEEIRINRRFSLLHQVVFRLNPSLVSQLQQIKQDHGRLTFDSSLIADLRYYVWLNSSLYDYQKRSPALDLFAPERSQLTFSTSYLEPTRGEQTLVRSSFNSAGKICQQIQQDLWQNPQLLDHILELHHWLIGQILTQLPLSPNKSLGLLFKGLGVLLLLVFTWTLGAYLNMSIGGKLLFFCLVYLGFKFCHQPIIKYTKKMVLYTLISSLWANTTYKRQIAWTVISLLS